MQTHGYASNNANEDSGGARKQGCVFLTTTPWVSFPRGKTNKQMNKSPVYFNSKNNSKQFYTAGACSGHLYVNPVY